ncbi:YvrJ family protein [Halanaerobium sp.]|jgi:hypothetical protein|uniref:YvrJ family protein n=1 Tax=Halanaerobium sp. TaxID=1895664 RepID=UPI000DE73A66|nr:YvrJ family protein [Halanaerobium sp.]PUU86907.1 MAG: hypothetical protein CI949_3836 [Halanaerobium sp.]
MEELFSLISSYGFPMVLSIFLLIRFEKDLKELNKSITSLIILIESGDKHNNYLN